MLQVIVARDVADLGVPDFTLDDLQSDWATPGLDLEHDVRVVDVVGAIRGYAILLGDDAVIAVHPEAEGHGTGTLLRRWAEARASERGTSVLRQFAHGANDGARRHLREAGYAPAQHYFRLRADLTEVPPPTELELRNYEPGDEEAVHRLIEDAFSEIDGYTPTTIEEWRARGTGKAGHDPSLWLLAEDEHGLAGAALGERWGSATGYCQQDAPHRETWPGWAQQSEQTDDRRNPKDIGINLKHATHIVWIAALPKEGADRQEQRCGNEGKTKELPF